MTEEQGTKENCMHRPWCNKHNRPLDHIAGTCAHRNNWYCEQCDKEREDNTPSDTNV